MIQVHIKALTALTKSFLPGMIKRGYGRILNIGSTGSYMPCPYDAVYAATKAYVLSFSNGLYQELKGTGVTVTCLCPGATQTLFAEKANINNTLLFKLFVISKSIYFLLPHDGKRKKPSYKQEYNHARSSGWNSGAGSFRAGGERYNPSLHRTGHSDKGADAEI